MRRGIQLAVLFGVLALLAWIVVRGSGRPQMEALGKALGPVAFLEHFEREGQWDGVVSSRNVQLIMNRQEVLNSLYFDEFRLHTPGLGHLMATPWGTPERIPDVFKLELIGVRGQPNSLKDHEGRVWFNFKSWVPFDAYGCRETGEFIEADFAGMAMGRRRATVVIEYEKTAAGTRLIIDWNNLDFPSIRLEAELTEFDLQDWLSRRFAVERAALKEISLTLNAGDYPVKRTAWCAKDRGVTEEQLLETNEAMASAFLNAVGLAAEPRLLDRWHNFNRVGGTITMNARYGRPLALASLRGKRLAEIFDALRLRVKTDGAPDIPMRLTDFVLPEFTVAATATVPAEPLDPSLEQELVEGETYNPLAEVTSGRAISRRLSAQQEAKVAAPVRVQSQPAQGPQPISFAQLQGEQGRVVIVITNKGVRYRGKVVRANAQSVELLVMLSGGTAQLSLKPSQVQRAFALRRRAP